ncbi:MAG: hypothetical protein RLZ13_1388, partial [Bacteroidota bacterium]
MKKFQKKWNKNINTVIKTIK